MIEIKLILEKIGILITAACLKKRSILFLIPRKLHEKGALYAF
tara:strand:- start:1005 stop:1133 length:129 start_codon:yes stop_codon:yes gene_type:complete